MAQADGVVANASGAAVRQDINNQLKAAFTNQSGDTAPSTKFPCSFYADTATNVLNIRDKTNETTYHPLRTLDGKVIMPAGSNGSPALFFNGTTDTGFFQEGSNVISMTKDGSQVCAFGKQMVASQTQSNCFVWGNVSSTSTPPGIGDNSASEAGLMIAKDGVTQIAAFDKRPLICNRMTASPSGQMDLIAFNLNGTQQGQIVSNGVKIFYQQNSDYRLKENVVPLTGAKERVNQLKVCRFNYIAAPGNTVDGFLAHELQEVVPDAVTGEKDAKGEDGRPRYQGVDQSTLVPLLSAALQEAFAEIAALTTRVEVLEAS